MSGSSMYTGVNGMSAQQQRMDVIANNIANMNTTGYKSTTLTFQEALVNTMTTPAVGTPGRQLGLGVSTGMTLRDFSNGAMNQTGVSSQFAIQGKAANPRQGNQIGPVRGLVKTGDLAGTSHHGEIGSRLFTPRRLDHADHAIGRHGVVDHVEIARLKNAQGQFTPWQKNGTVQREDGNNLGKVHGGCVHVRRKE